MSKIDEAIPALTNTARKLDHRISKDVMSQACHFLGNNLFRRDAALVAFSQKNELIRIRENFIKKVLDVQDPDDAIDQVLMKIGAIYGKSNRNKKRAVVYALLMVHYGVKTIPAS